MFVATMTEKLLTFALGRGVEYYDAPAIRQAVRSAGVASLEFTGPAESSPPGYPLVLASLLSLGAGVIVLVSGSSQVSLQ